MLPGLDAPNAHNRVHVFSKHNAPPAALTPVVIHYFELGIAKTVRVDMRAPTYFEKLVVSTVHEILPSPPQPPITLNSLRNAARIGYHTARYLKAAILPPLVLRRPVLDTRIWEPNNMSHLLIDIIPYSLYARHSVGPDMAVLFRKVGKRFRELLNLFKLAPLVERRRIEADVVKIRGTRGLALYDFDLKNTFDCPGIVFVPDIYAKMDFSSSTKFENIFLARRGARSLINQSEIEKILARFGYKTVYMEDYSLTDQLSIGTQVKHVIAIHGAAMSFLVMSKRIESMIELLPPNNYSAWFPVSLGGRVLHYEQIIPIFDEKVAHGGWDKIAAYKDLPFVVSPQLLERVLSNIH